MKMLPGLDKPVEFGVMHRIRYQVIARRRLCLGKR